MDAEKQSYTKTLQSKDAYNALYWARILSHAAFDHIGGATPQHTHHQHLRIEYQRNRFKRTQTMKAFTTHRGHAFFLWAPELLCALLFLLEGEATSCLEPISCCTLKLRSYCSITWLRPDSTRIVCADVKSLRKQGEDKI